MELEKESLRFYQEEQEISDEDCPDLVPGPEHSMPMKGPKVPGK